MSEQSSPEGMITVEDFAKRKGLTPDKLIAMIKDGLYVGRVIGEQWYVELSGASTSSKSKAGNAYRPEYETARKISMFISFLGCFVFAGGLLLRSQGWLVCNLSIEAKSQFSRFCLA